MQAIFKDTDERRCSERTDLVNIVLYARRISTHLEGEYVGIFEARKFGV